MRRWFRRSVLTDAVYCHGIKMMRKIKESFIIIDCIPLIGTVNIEERTFNYQYIRMRTVTTTKLNSFLFFEKKKIELKDYRATLVSLRYQFVEFASSKLTCYRFYHRRWPCIRGCFYINNRDKTCKLDIHDNVQMIRSEHWHSFSINTQHTCCFVLL